MSEAKSLDVKLMDREFRLACLPEEEETLLLAVSIFDQKMQEIQATGKVVGVEKIAIMAALNIINDYLRIRVEGGVDFGSIQGRMRHLTDTIESVLREQSPLPF